MQDKQLIFWILTFGLSVPAVVSCAVFYYFYKRERNLVRKSTDSISGTVIGYNHFRDGNPPIVEYTVNGVTYKKSFRYFLIKTISTPWTSSETPNFYTREDILARSLTIYKNSFFSVTRLMQVHFPIGSSMTVWYDPAQPNRAYVERYCGLDRYYKWWCIGLGSLLLIIYLVSLIALYLTP